MAQSSPAGPAEEALPAPATPTVDDLLEHLRDRDQILERVARRMAHPKGAPVDSDELQRFVESLERLDLWIGPLAEDHPELVMKHQALMARAREVANASTRSRAENADLVVLDESIRRLWAPAAAFVDSSTLGESLSQAACAEAPKLGVGVQSISGLDASRDLLVRFVAPTDGRYLIDTGGSRTDTRLAVLDGCHGTELVRADDESGMRARAQISARRGQEIWIRIGSDRAGFVRLAIEQLTGGVGTSSISGTVVARASGMPVQGITLWAQSDFSGTYSTTTDSAGNYFFSGLAAGTYEVFTQDFSGSWINQIWDGIDCGLYGYACESAEGDEIPVAEAQTIEDIDFSLSRSSVLSGRVTDSTTGLPLGGAEVGAFADGDSRYTSTDAQGRFRFALVEPGIYFLQASAERHGTELYDDIDCSAGCTITDGTPVEVMPDDNTAGLDFALDPAAGIGGVVTSASSGSPVGNEYVYVYDDQGDFVGSDRLDSDGTFFIPVPGAGTYFARTNFYSYDSWVNQMWQGIDCPYTCDLGLATPIVLGAMEIALITFEVMEKGQIEGTVSAADGGDLGDYFDSRVRVFDDEGNYIDSSYVSGNGDYVLENMPPGDHFATASNPEFRSKVFDDLACAAGNVCDPLAGTPIAVSFGSTTPGIDFSLERLGIIEGRVTKTGGVVGVEGVYVRAEETAETRRGPEAFFSSANTDENGDFRLVGLEPASYDVFTSSTGYLDEAYDDLPCEGSCDLSLADPVVVPGVPSVVSGIDFELQRRGWIEGTMTDSMTAQNLSGYITLYRPDGTEVGDTYVGSGEFLFEGLEDGSYYLLTNASPDVYVNELHDDVYCERFSGGLTCDLASGVQVAVSVDSGASVDFELDRGGTIEGTIEDELGNTVSYASIHVFNLAGQRVGGDSAYSGSYLLEGLAPGDYYVVTQYSDHIDELWPDVVCLGQPFPNCTLSDGTAVGVSLDTTTSGVDFVLADLATISGQVVDSETGLQVEYPDLYLYNESGGYVDTAYGSPFEFAEVLPGTYFLRTYYTPNYVEGVYGGGLCDPFCDPTMGTPIVVGVGGTVSGLEIALVQGPGIKGRVIDGTTGSPVSGVSIDVWNSFGEHRGSAVSDEEGWYRLPEIYGTVYLSTHNDDGLEDFLFDGVPCPEGSAWEGLCDPMDGTPYFIEEYSPLQRLDFAFGDPTIFSDGLESGDMTTWSSAVGAD